jgi:hypothetical protein
MMTRAATERVTGAANASFRPESPGPEGTGEAEECKLTGVPTFCFDNAGTATALKMSQTKNKTPKQDNGRFYHQPPAICTLHCPFKV